MNCSPSPGCPRLSAGPVSKFRAQSRKRVQRGITLVEMTVVILVLLMLVSILWFWAQSWKAGSDRAMCIMNIRFVQVGMRSYTHTSAYQPGQDLSPLNLKDEVIGVNKHIEVAPRCPGGGVYMFAGNTVPEIGSLYMTCTLSDSKKHVPNNHESW